jgi:2-haloacid dehalogenase
VGTEPASIESVVFDVGGVLVDWDPRHLYRSVFDDPEEMERFLAEVCSPEWHAPHDRGVSTAASCAELARRHPGQAELIWAWWLRSEEMVAGEVPGTARLVEELVAAGRRCFALTNMEAETYPLRRERFPFFAWFDGVVVSGLEGVSKPDPEIFCRLLDRYSLDEHATLFVDDNADNVETAASLGMQTVRFESADQLRDRLVQLRLLER